MLSPRKINLLPSPQKENAKSGRKSPIKNSYESMHATVIKLLQIISQSGIKLSAEQLKQFPTNIPNNILQKNSLILKQNSDLQNQKQAALLKKINDLTFQLKKTGEDYAEEILLLKMAHSKETKKQKEKYAQLEAIYLQQTKNMQSKTQQLKFYYEKNFQKLKSEVEESKQVAIIEAKKQYEAEVKELNQQISSYQIKTKQKVQKAVEEIKIDTSKKIEEIQQIVTLKEKQKQQEYEKHKEHLQKVEMRWENRRLTWEEQVKQQRAKYDQKIIDLSKQKQKLYTDLYLVRKDNSQLKDKIIGLKKQIKNLEINLEKKNQELKEIEKNHEKKLKKQKEMYNQSLKDYQNSFEQKNKSTLQQHLRFLCKKQQKIRELETLYQTHLSLSAVKLEQSEQKFDKRAPRQQDTEKIQKFQGILLKKNLEIKELKENYQRIKLETQNNEKNYNRIFSTTKRASSAHPTNRDPGNGVLNFSKQGHTVDMSFILKACKKNF